MAKTVVLNIKVNDAELVELEKGLEELGADFKVVEGGAKGATKETEKLGKFRSTVRELDKYTGGWASKIFDVGAGLKDVVKGLNLSKAALIGTGIGAFVVALGLVVQYWDEIVDYITGANEKLQEQIDMLDKKNDILESEIAILDANEKLLKEQGKSTDDIIKKKRELLQVQIGILGAELALLQAQRDRATKAAEELTLWERFINNSIFTGFGAAGGISNEEQSEIDDITLKINNLIAAIKEAQLGIYNLDNPDPEKTKRPKIDKVDDVFAAEMEQAEIRRKALIKTDQDIFDSKKQLQDSAIAANQEFFDSELVQTQQANAKRNQIEKGSAKYRKWLAEQEAKAKVQSYMLAANGFAAASELIGRETAAGKAFAVASTLISTYLSAQQAYQSQIAIPTPDAPFRATLAAAVAVAAGLANVKQILSTKIPGGYGSSGSIGASPSIPPAFNVVGTSPQNQLNQALVQQNNQPVQAYVVEGEVTTAEQMRRGKIVASSIG